MRCDAEGTTNIARCDTVLTVAEKPNGEHPSVYTNGRAFKYCVCFDAKLPVTFEAVPDMAASDEGQLFRAAAKTSNDSGRPTKVASALKGPIEIAEIDDGLLNS
jgi:hypothetical protein